jgi:hypothetical protein
MARVATSSGSPIRPRGISERSSSNLAYVRLQCGVHGNLDSAGGHIIDGDAVRRQLHRYRPRQHAQAAPGGAVRGVGRHRQVLVHRRDVDDASGG